jgi:hypothetical protein
MEECVYDKAYQGKCGSPATGTPPVCMEHLNKKCWCGEPAVRECCVASSFVCGAPLCADHGCRLKAAGMTGSHGSYHSEKGHKQHEEFIAKQKEK